ncbi:MAG: hypothetical protein QNK37_10280 [Acidobacteriota bacterium]|nr:hypothetical protein [Acidobacteriota bacterium]
MLKRVKNLTAVVFLLVAAPLWAQVSEGWQALVYNDYEAARDAFAGADQNDTLAQIGWFLTYTGRGPTAELEDAGLTILRRDPTSGASEFVLKWMLPFRECLSSWVEQSTALCDGKTPNNPELKYLYATDARMRARYRTETPDFAGITSKAGFITQWLISPRYGAYPIADWSRQWPTDKAAGWDKAIPHTSPSGVVLPPREANGAGVYYAFSTFENPVEQDVTLRIFSYQNITVYVNGKLWHKARHLEELGGNVDFVRGKLPAGRHEVVVKVTQLRNNNGQFSVQVSADQAPKLADKPDRPTVDLTDEQLPTSIVSVGLAAELEGVSGDLAKFVRAVLFHRDRNIQAALETLEPLVESYPNSLLIGGRTADIYLNMVPYLPQQDQISRAYQMLGTLARIDSPHNLEVRLSMALLLEQAKQTRPSLELINNVIESNPQYCDALRAALLQARKQSLFDLRTKTLNRIEDLGPSNHWGQTTLLAEARRDADLTLTRTLLENLSRLLPWDGYVAQINTMDENYQAAVDDLTRRWELFPDRDFYPYSIAEAYTRLGNHKAQREWLEKTLDINPAHREAILDLVNLDCFEGKKDDARRRLAEYLQVEPADAFFRQRLSHLEGRSAFEDFRVPAEEVIAEAKNKPMSQGADSELLLDQLMVRLFPDGSQMRYTHMVTRVLTKKGVDEEGEINLRQNLELLNLRTIKQDGSVFYPESFDHKNTISLAGIGVGDFIDEEHIEYLPPAYYDRDGLDGDMNFIFQGLDRIYHHSELVLIYPADLEPKPVLLDRHMPVKPTIEEKDGMVSVRWLTKDMPPLPNEPGMADRVHFQPTATFYWNTKWEEIRDYYISNISPRQGLSNRVKAQVAKWITAYPDPLERAEAVYREVADRTEPGGSIYTNANLVWETSEGNATLLLNAMYREMGYRCDIVFVTTREGEEASMGIPIPAFAYTLLRLKVGEQTFWLDPNQQNLPFGYIPFPFRGIRGMVLSPDELFDMVPEFEDSSEAVETDYKLYFSAEGAAEGMGSEKFNGMYSAQMKRGFAAMNKPEMKQRIEAGLNTTYPGSAVKRASITEDLPVGQFEVTHDFSHPALAEKDGMKLKLAFPLPKTPLLERYGALPTRRAPIRISQPHYNIARVELVAPKGYAWTNGPVNVVKEDELGRYELKVIQKEDRKLLLERTYYLKARTIQPDAYGDFLEFCKAMVENEDITFVAAKEGGNP